MNTPFTQHSDFHGQSAAEQQRTERLVHSPFISTTPERGAHLIVRAWTRGRRVLIYPWAVRAGVALRWMFPHLTLRAAHWFSRHT
jgi:hypothetical protein